MTLIIGNVPLRRRKKGKRKLKREGPKQAEEKTEGVRSPQGSRKGVRGAARRRFFAGTGNSFMRYEKGAIMRK